MKNPQKMPEEAKFLYDGWNLAAELDANNNLVRSYFWGTDLSGSFQGAGGVGGLLAVNVATNRVHFPAYDGNGNVAGLVSASSGAVTARFEYGPFTEPIRVSWPIAKAMPLRFSNKYLDEETGLYYYGYRYYDPSAGRWLSRDPIQERGGRNLYGFINNNPVNGIDMLGLTLVAEIPAEIALEIEEGVSLAQIAADYGLTLEQVTQMAAALATAKAVQEIVKNAQRNAKGKDPCEKAKSALRQVRKGIESLEKVIQDHQGWINDPTSYPGGGVTRGDPRIPQWISKWLGDIARAQGNIEKSKQAVAILEKAVDAACKCWYKPWTWF